ncbi:MAG TPA: hypothetical protein VFI54_14525 [Solirubrobacteraceae bacterium]|nr:hypothetical protein [Solirubrobacteraceae bacterium]
MPTSDETSGAVDIPSDRPITVSRDEDELPPASEAQAGTMVPFPVLAAPTVVHVSKLSAEAIARCDLRDVEYVVIDPAQAGWRLRPAEIEDQLKHEQEGGLGRVTYSLGEFLDEFTNAPSNPAPTFDRLAQFKRDYAKLTPPQRDLFRAAVKKFVAPFSTTPPGEFGQPHIRELKEHPGYYELRFATDTRAIYTFGEAIRRGQPHVVWCRIGSDGVLDQPPVICTPTD